ncbi:helix-turn-helix domain-containing protein [Spirillospora sp. NPDC047279]|uniref:helix-turn-helix domain-containing protein n=1 Tax=Spirillospora sp. NPDC047279 TaxID=3155478 RepID=UPI0033E93606
MPNTRRVEHEARLHPAAAIMADILRPQLAALADEVVKEIETQVPSVGRLLQGETRTAALRAVASETAGFLAWAVGGEPVPAEHGMRAHEAFIARAFLDGCSLGDLQTAYQVGARIIWRWVSQAGAQAGVDPEYMYHLADAIFSRLQGVSAESGQALDSFETAPQDALRKVRQRLVRLLLSDVTPIGPAITTLTREAKWQIPARVVCVALDGPEARRAAPFTFDNDVLPDLERPDPCLIVPADGLHARRRMLRRTLRTVTHSIGPPAEPTEAPLSMTLARQALDLAQEGVLPAGAGQIRCDEHLAMLHLTSSERHLRLLRRTSLEPFARLSADRRSLLLETLLAWLTHGAATSPQVATELCVHPQTVRYRMRQIRHLVGTACLQDPAWRFEMQLALRSWDLDRRRTQARSKPPPDDSLPRTPT